MLAPAWLDHVALVAGIEPPARQNGFAWCDLGCGQGVTAAILAATHPSGVFHGIDAMPAHIDHARRLAAAAAIPNLELHAVDFAAALGLELPQFDYIVAHGVYTWIGPEAQRAVRRFIDRRLKPGGLVYLGYNAMPGWARDLPFQGLVREFGRTFPGDNTARLAAAAAARPHSGRRWRPVIGGELHRQGIAGAAGRLSAGLSRPRVHAPAWQPLYVTEVRRDMATIGLEPVGSATLIENFDWMVLDEAARRMLGAITDPDARELVRDYYLDQRFRCDVFARGNRPLGLGERAGRLHSSTFVLARPVPAIRYTTTTPAGPFAYDSPAARAIVAGLAAGQPASTGDLRTLLTLCAAADIMPAEPGRASVSDLNRALSGRVDGPEEIRWLALPCGTAVEVGSRACSGLCATVSRSMSRLARFLASHGSRPQLL